MALTRAIFPCLSMQLISRDNGQIQIHIGQDDASAARRDAFAAGASRRCRPADLVCDPGLKNGGYTVDNDESAAVELDQDTETADTPIGLASKEGRAAGGEARGRVKTTQPARETVDTPTRAAENEGRVVGGERGKTDLPARGVGTQRNGDGASAKTTSEADGPRGDKGPRKRTKDVIYVAGVEEPIRKRAKIT